MRCTLALVVAALAVVPSLAFPRPINGVQPRSNETVISPSTVTSPSPVAGVAPATELKHKYHAHPPKDAAAKKHAHKQIRQLSAARDDLAQKSKEYHSCWRDAPGHCDSQLNSLSSSVSSVRSILGPLARDRGIANYDPDNSLEHLIKDIINLLKDLLTDVHELIAGLPVAGPLLGSLVYEVKCVADDLLNSAENTTDGALNDSELGSLLGPLHSQALGLLCHDGLGRLGGIGERDLGLHLLAQLCLELHL
ncbi:hypothetical protein BOTBODRAFT_191756 [Botryobasidium botryosum FD-172 SS1]|uniref:Uncharacterized protein n=1 Tax=Botryobasidium botryosum (strain FD-172 SS1) TaxID=930990 RepID=A0A067MA68_BOTB1|nr:hypothetical protein BOTBODRAFT_191756 [Botryobasidium botryosum FD-172 SS1]